MSDSLPISASIEEKLSARLRYQRWRLFKDSLVRWGVGFGGVSVVIAIVLIFFYLLFVVLPLFAPASMDPVASYDLPGSKAKTLYLAMEEHHEIGLRVSTDGEASFFATADGSVLKNHQMLIPNGAAISAFSPGVTSRGSLAFGLDDGRLVVAQHVYRLSYPNDVRKIEPDIEYPLGEEALDIDEYGKPLVTLAMQDGTDEVTVAAMTGDGRLLLTHFAKEESMLDEEVSLERNQVVLPAPEIEVRYLLLDKDQRNLYVASADGTLIHYDVTDKEDPTLKQRLRLVDAGREITSLRFLAGDISLLVGDSSGRVVQWFGVRDARGNEVLTPIREFHEQDAAINDLAAEFNRKGFVAAGRDGYINIYHSTSERNVVSEKVSSDALQHLAIAPHANALLAEDLNRKLRFWHIENEHPEISWSALWNKVWYESYEQPVYAWQSSSASNDFEPKLSLTPLVFGTLKAAFYAMLLAVPLAILGAIYTAYFMAPKLRQVVKPGIETMEALPTVILGFLAGLWLAPMLEANLPGIFSLFLMVPLGVLVFAFTWHHAPISLRRFVPEGWDAALLIPVVLVLAWSAFSLSSPMEQAFFGGDMRGWLTNELGIGFDQRNAMVVGLAMGFAVIPNIFSITEDAIFSVPKHLTNGSLALGATPWQTLTRVVILTASPGIFSAVMIGMGRAVGETMIVLMATGNTPVMDFSIFQGMRTLSANIGVEMPESEVDSTHFRVLFLAALVLFMFTFIFNTAAEIVRQRLRTKYSSL